MEKLKTRIATLPTIMVDGETYLSYQAVTDTVAAFLFPEGAPTHPAGQIDEAGYQRILETADSLCRELGYAEIVKLTPPEVPLNQMGLYWSAAPRPAPEPELEVIHIGPGRIEMLEDGHLLDARLHRLGLDEVTRQHFKISVIASDGVIDLMRQAVASDWPNDYKGLWHDILGMCIAGGRDIGPDERLFTVIIRGLGRRRYWQFKVRLEQDNAGAPFLYICLSDEAGTDGEQLFPLGHVVMTPGAAALGVDFAPYLAHHVAGDWGEVDDFDRQQNDTAVKEGYRILSAYNIPIGDGKTERIWIITEADRACTTLLLPTEY
jgi:hypothetical protein